MAGLIGLAATPTQGQWTFETIDATVQSRSSAYVGVAADGTVVAMYSGDTDGMSCDGTADVYIKVRVAPGNWIEPACVYTPSRLRVTRPHMAVDAAGNIYLAYEYRWAYYTGVMKFTRTGPTTWVRDGDPVLIRSPGIMPCGQADPNLPSNYWVYGYNPKIAVAPNGSLCVIVFPNIDSVATTICCYNSGADWRNNWQVIEWPWTNGSSLVADDNSDFHLALATVDPGGDPNLADNVYVKLHNCTPVIGPTVIDDGGARTGEASIGVGGNGSVFLASAEWNLNGNGVWNLYQWTINGTVINSPVAITSPAPGITAPRVAARNNSVRYFFRTDASDARWAWWMVRPGVYTERVSLPGHDTGDMRPIMDSGNNLHVGILDWDAVSGNVYRYGYRPTDEPPPTGPHGTISGTVYDTNAAAVPNATVQTQTGIVAVTDASGAYSMSVAAGTYSVTAQKLFYAPWTFNGISVADGQTVAVDFSLAGEAPAAVTAFALVTGNTGNSLTWTNPTSSQYTGTRVVCKTSGYPSGPEDGLVVVDETGWTGATRAVTHSGLTNGVTYYYAAYTYHQDASRFYGPAVSVSGAPAVKPDFDHDGDVDQADFGHLQECYSGAFVPQNDAACQGVKLDEDPDVDLDDFAVFAGCMSGEGVPAAVDCAR